jgi:DMSO/TMAO reductase YedYZ molybdopterin-dependent catalytic subunit
MTASIQAYVISESPENRETPLRDAQSWVTPGQLFFVRSHFDTPEVDLDTWRLRIGGCVRKELELTWERLNALPQRSVFATLECAGNGRSFLLPRVDGVQWRAGAVGHAEWSGVPLKYVLQEAGLAADVMEVVFTGADSGGEKDQSHEIPFARSLPVAKALHPDTLLALRMNGEVLSPSHGYPLRLLAPGWYGVASVKWLSRIEAVTEPFQGYYQTVKYTVQRKTGRGLETEVVGAMQVKSEIIRPVGGTQLGVGTNRIFGMAWGGEVTVVAVEVSVDGGRSWHSAELNGPRAPYSWTLWEYLWHVHHPGSFTLMSRAISEDGSVQPTQHDPLRGGYLINFSRAAHVTVDAASHSEDVLSDDRSLQREIVALAEERSRFGLDVELVFDEGAGI